MESNCVKNQTNEQRPAAVAVATPPKQAAETRDRWWWVDIATNQAGTNGVITVFDYFSDLSSNPPASAFYQLTWQP